MVTPLTPTPTDSCDYHMTVTLKPRLYKYTVQEQIDLTAEKLRIVLIDTLNTCVIECTKSYNIHYHIIFKVPLHLTNNPRKFIIDRLRNFHNFFGYIKIDQVIHYDKYIDYIRKDINETRKHIFGCVVLKDDYHIQKDDDNPWCFPRNINKIATTIA